MFDKIKNSINSLLRAQKGEGNQFFTADGKQKLIETRTFLRKYTRLIFGVFVTTISISIAFVWLVKEFLMSLIMPLVLRGNALTYTMANGGSVNFGDFIGSVVGFAIVFVAGWIMVRQLAGSIETPQEERVRRCPMCGENILQIAIKCKHCGSTVGRERTDTYRSRPSRSSSSSYRSEKPAERRYTPSSESASSSSSGGQSSSSSSQSSQSSRRRRNPSYRRRSGRYHSRGSSGDRGDSRGGGRDSSESRENR